MQKSSVISGLILSVYSSPQEQSEWKIIIITLTIKPTRDSWLGFASLRFYIQAIQSYRKTQEYPK